MGKQQRIQAVQFQDTGWQRLQPVEAQVQVGQAGQVTQASRQSGQGTMEAGTEGTPALATWKWGRQVYPSELEFHSALSARESTREKAAPLTQQEGQRKTGKQRRLPLHIS